MTIPIVGHYGSVGSKTVSNDHIKNRSWSMFKTKQVSLNFSENPKFSTNEQQLVKYLQTRGTKINFLMYFLKWSNWIYLFNLKIWIVNYFLMNPGENKL